MTTRFSSTPNPEAANSPANNAIERNTVSSIHSAYFSLGMLIVFALAHLFSLIFFAQDWELYVLTAVFIIGAVISVIGISQIKKGRRNFGILLILFTIQFCLLVASLFIARIGLMMAVFIIMLTIIVTSAVPDLKRTNLILFISLIVAYFSVTVNVLRYNMVTILHQLDILPLEYLYGLLMVLVIVLLVFLAARKLLHLSIQTKLLADFLGLILLPLVGLTLLINQSTTSLLIDQSNQSLVRAAKQTSDSLDAIFQKGLADITSEAQNPDFNAFLNMPAGSRPNSTESIRVQAGLDGARLKDSQNILSYALLDANGLVVASTDANEVGQNDLQRDYFASSALGRRKFISPIEFEPQTHQAVFYISAPVIMLDNSVGILRARYDAAILTQTLSQEKDLVQAASYPILFDENLIRLADPTHPQDIYKAIVPLSSDRISALKNVFALPDLPSSELSINLPQLADAVYQGNNGSNFSAIAFNDGKDMMGGISSMTTQNWKVAYLQDKAIILAPADAQNRSSTLYVALSALIACILGIGLASMFSRPITSLTNTAQRIASGDLLAQAKINTNDEIETLAVAFNLMTSQLRSSIEGLEVRVQERTQELARQTQRISYRVIQLQTLSDVARAITSVQEVDQLLTNVARLTSERFNFYHVGIFLLDENKEYAVLRATNSEGGQKMLARAHRLKVGETGIVGNVASTGKARITTDVGEDAVFFSNPDLPLTRSEMALPLKSGEETLGVLDVQSITANAFTEDDISLFSTLADQVAIALINNRLFNETRQALAEAQATHRRYLRQEWDRTVISEDIQGLQLINRRIVRAEDQDAPEIAEAIQKGEVCMTSDLPPQNGGHTPTGSTLAVPIILRGEVIGVIGMQENAGDRQWQPEEVDMVTSVADQVAIALENARLFEQTVRRAERERKVLDITSKIRANNDPQAMLKTAITELQQALKASRAQILLQSSLSSPEADDSPSDGNNGSDTGS